MECDIREAMAVHKKRSASECKHRPKRRCLARWSGGLGADKESDLDGRRVTPHGQRARVEIAVVSRCLPAV